MKEIYIIFIFYRMAENILRKEYIPVPDYDDIVSAGKILKGVAVRTPLLKSFTLAEAIGGWIIDSFVDF